MLVYNIGTDLLKKIKMLNNLNAIGKIVDYYHSLFLAENIGYKSLPKEDRDLLKEKGYKNIEKKHEDLLTLAYIFGKISVDSDPRILDKMNFQTLQQLAGEKQNLTREDRYVIEHLKGGFYNDVKRANNRVKDNINSEIVRLNKDRRYYIRKKLKGKFSAKDFKADPELLNGLTKYLGGKQKEWNDHFDLITQFNFHLIAQQGHATALLEKYGNETMIWYKVHSTACIICKKLLLYPNGKPRIFKLLDILSHGDNIGRKVADTRVIIGPIHVRCRCAIQYNRKKIVKK